MLGSRVYSRDQIRETVAEALPHPVWFGDRMSVEHKAPLEGNGTCDLAIVGGGLTGLWAAIEGIEENPDRKIVVLEAKFVGYGASGRNGGFVSTSLTHGLAHGHSAWSDEMPRLIQLGEENVAEMDQFVTREGIDADLRWCGKTLLATRPHEVGWLEDLHALHTRYGLKSELLGRDEMQSEVKSPTYLGGLQIPSGGLVDPLALVRGLMEAAERRGVRIYHNSPVDFMGRSGAGITLKTPHGLLRAGKVVIATNAFRPLLSRLQLFMIPVWDHVLATEPLSPEQMDAVGWSRNQGLTDSGNQFHYYRRTCDNRILWGGYDAIYYFGRRTDPRLAYRSNSHELLARQFYETFPQLEGLRMSHRWAGTIDTTSRFTPMFGTALDRRVSYVLGYTGLGVASSRFGARVALDLLAGRTTSLTQLRMVRRKPVPFPPEPLLWATVQVTRSALAREDRRGRRGPWLRVLDHFGVGFDS